MFLRPQYRFIAPAALYGGGSILQEDYTAASTLTWLTHTRSGHAMMFDSTGKLTFAPANILYYSNDPTQTSKWDKLSLTSVTGDGTNGWLLLPNGTSTSEHGIYAYSYATATDTSIFSVDVKPSGYNYCSLRLDAASGGIAFTLTGSGTAGTPVGSVTGGITALADGWYRIWCKGATVSFAVRIYVTTDTSLGGTGTPSTAFSGDGSSGLLIRKAQLEPVTYETSPRTYNATGASVYYGPRFDYNPVGPAARGLLIEGSRTNSLTYSNNFSNAAWTKNNVTISQNVTGIDGTTSAWTMTDDATSGEHRIYAAYTANNAASIQIVAKAGSASYISISPTGAADKSATFNLSDGTVYASAAGTASTVSLGNGFYLLKFENFAATTNYCIINMGTTGANAATAASYSGSGSTVIIQNCQEEIGAFCTSYIPTTTASVARAADSVAAALYTSDSVSYYAREVSDLSQFNTTLNPFSNVSSESDVWIEKVTKP
jgi:hypothetical protein